MRLRKSEERRSGHESDDNTDGTDHRHRDESSVRQEALVADHSIEVERGAAAQNGDAALLRRAGQPSGHT